MQRLIAAFSLALLLVACGKPEPVAVPGGLRNPTVPIYSNAVFEPGRITGTWVQVAGFAPASGPDCRGGQVQISGAALATVGNLCINGAMLTVSGPLAVTGPGRLTPAQADGVLTQAWWVIWADVDYRTLVIGTPSGDFGFILNREASLPGDRLTAAKEVLEWNGYDLTRLRVYGR